MRSRVLYYFITTLDFQIGAPAVAGIGAPPVPSRRTRLSTMPTPFGYMFYDKTEIDSESCEVTVQLTARGNFGPLYPTKALTVRSQRPASFIRVSATRAVHVARLDSLVRAPLLQPRTAPPTAPVHCTLASMLPAR